jgi:hypothetical protein
MLPLALLLLSLAVVMGGVLALRTLRSAGLSGRYWWLAGLLHGAIGVCGLGALAVSLGGPARGEAMGVAGFGQGATWSFVLAACLGAAIPLVSGQARGWGGPLLAVHAAVAITAYVLFLAWWALG